MFVYQRYSLQWQEEGVTTQKEKILENVTWFNFNNLVRIVSFSPSVEKYPPPGHPYDIFNLWRPAAVSKLHLASTRSADEDCSPQCVELLVDNNCHHRTLLPPAPLVLSPCIHGFQLGRWNHFPLEETAPWEAAWARFPVPGQRWGKVISALLEG